jgi:thiamine pyrophosphokinase
LSGRSTAPRLVRAIVIADGDVPARSILDAAWTGWDEGAGFIVAADGGALGATRLGLRPDLVVGDLDSLAPSEVERIRREGIEVEAWPVTKDASDAELALRAALARDPVAVTILGALGGSRFDHALANVWLLALPEAAGREAALLDGRTRVRLLTAPGRLDLSGRPGDLVTLLAFGGDADGVTTEGLAYPLRDEPLAAGPSRGLSNVRSDRRAGVAVRAGRLLVIEIHEEGVQP